MTQLGRPPFFCARCGNLHSLDTLLAIGDHALTRCFERHRGTQIHTLRVHWRLEPVHGQVS